MNLFSNILAAKHNLNENVIQFIIFAVIAIFGILKTLFGTVKSMSQQKNFDKNYKPARPKKPLKYIDSADDFKTMEQLRDEKITQIRATFGIPSPKPPMMQPEEFGKEEEEEYVAPAPPPVPQKKYIQRPQTRRVSPTVSQPEMLPLSKHYEQPKQTPAKHKQPSSSSKPQPLAPVNAIFSSADDLRKAVLYQEILGKPVALRD